jgi:hypothetical protein
MAIGGFNGEGGNLTLAQFKTYVLRGDIHYFLATNAQAGRGNGANNAEAAITSWVEAHFTAKQIGGQTVYALVRGGK